VSGRDTNFYYSFVVLPPAKRQAIIAVWDFCRAVDDAVDENRGMTNTMGPGARHQASCDIAEWRAELARCYDGHAPQTPQGRRLKPFVERFQLPRHAFDDVIDGVAMDLEHQRYETFDALYEYCLRVASAVGLICVEIFGYRDDRSRDFAVQLGVALQLTNIIRDVRVDLADGRVYLPQEDLRRFGCSEDDLRKGEVTDPVRALIRFECDRARTYYEHAQRALPSADARALIAARIMAAIYFEILRSIERANYDVFSRVIRVPRPRRAVIAATTWAQGMVFG
jgi:15-cis-phytoene synthase